MKELIPQLSTLLEHHLAQPRTQNQEAVNIIHAGDQPVNEDQDAAVLAPNQNAFNNVQLLNEAAQKGNFTVSYIAEAAGEAHNPLWTLRVRGK